MITISLFRHFLVCFKATKGRKNDQINVGDGFGNVSDH